MWIQTVAWTLVAVVGPAPLAATPPKGGHGRATPSEINQAELVPEPAWDCHNIDARSGGADGTKLGDINGDGLSDIVVGWEEGNRARVYLNPGYDKAKQEWPSVDIGKTISVEDAVFVDLDGNGMLDVVTCCEGKMRSMYVHWAPDAEDLLKPGKWEQVVLPASEKKNVWMFAEPMEVDGKNGVDLIAGGKYGGSKLGWFEAPADPRDLAEWQWHPITPVAWVMSILTRDMDGDGDLDVVITDRKSQNFNGARWLENPGPGDAQKKMWTNHFMCQMDKAEMPMFMDMGDLDGDGLEDAVVALFDYKLLLLRRLDATGLKWERQDINVNFGNGWASSPAIGDINGDGHPDIAFSCMSAEGLHGVVWLENPGQTKPSGPWRAHPVSGSEKGVKFDMVKMLDLDGDGDLDLLTSEQGEGGKGKGLGVIWYENPHGDGRKR